jgi:hypothetical protein
MPERSMDWRLGIPGVRVRWSEGGSAGSGGEVAWKQEVLGKGV